MKAEAGSSSGARGVLRSLRPASWGRRLALRALTSLLDQTRFSQVSRPPRERGRTWSRLPSSGRSNAPVYWQSRCIGIAFANGLRAELRALPWHAGEVHGDNDGRHADLAADGVDGLIAIADWQSNPLFPRDWADGPRGEGRVWSVEGKAFGIPPVARPLTLALSPSDGERECILHLFEFD